MTHAHTSNFRSRQLQLCNDLKLSKSNKPWAPSLAKGHEHRPASLSTAFRLYTFWSNSQEKGWNIQFIVTWTQPRWKTNEQVGYTNRMYTSNQKHPCQQNNPKLNAWGRLQRKARATCGHISIVRRLHVRLGKGQMNINDALFAETPMNQSLGSRHKVPIHFNLRVFPSSKVSC